MTTTASRRPRARRIAKVLVSGPQGAGRTTFISTLTRPTASAAGDGDDPGTSGPASPTTVELDFGRVEIDEDLSLVLHGTPAHDRYGFMVDILAEGMIGYLLLVDSTRPETLVDARRLRRRFEQAHRVPSVVVVTKLTGDEASLERRIREELELPHQVPVLAIDARQREDVQRAVVTLLTAALESSLVRSAEAHRRVGLGDVG